MTAELEHLVRGFERGAISRRELMAALGALCAAGTARASAQERGSRAPIPLSGMDHSALRVSDLARSTAFYRDHLGGRIRSRSPSSVFLDVGHRSVDERMGVLRARGLDPVSPAGSGRVYFRDPDGIILQLSRCGSYLTAELSTGPASAVGPWEDRWSDVPLPPPSGRPAFWRSSSGRPPRH